MLVHCCFENRISWSLRYFLLRQVNGKNLRCIVNMQLKLYHRKPAILNRNLHWLDFELGIIVYDPYYCPYKFHIIEFPADVDKEHYGPNYGSICRMCGVHQGRLKYFEVSRPFRLESFSEFKIWVLEDYNSDHWYLKHRVRIEDILFGDGLNRYEFFAPVSFHPFDAHIVYTGWDKILVSYNIQTRRMDALGFPHNPEEILRIDWQPCWECFLLVLTVCIPPSLAL